MKPEACTLTLREAFDKYYVYDLSNAGTIKSIGHDLNRWERLTSNPPVAEITNRTLAAFRDAMLAAGLSPATFNTTRNSIRMILRRLGPQETGNPLGEGILSRIPYVKKLPVPRDFPRIWSLAELSAMYEACDVAQGPRSEIPAPDFFRTLLVVGYNLIPRRGDISHLRTDAVDWENGLLRWCARKTRKWHVLPMNDVVQAHLRRIWSDREYVFANRSGDPPTPGNWQKYLRSFYRIAAAAGITDPPLKPLHTLRRTGASFLNSTVYGSAGVIGGWATKGIEETFYRNPAATGDLQRAVDNLPQPPAFLKILESASSSNSLLARRTSTRTTEWEFTADSAAWRGTTLRLRGGHGGRLLRALQLLASARRPLTFDDFGTLLFWEGEISRTRVKTLLYQLRDKLKRELPLPPMFDPIPFIDEGYVLRLP